MLRVRHGDGEMENPAQDVVNIVSARAVKLHSNDWMCIAKSSCAVIALFVEINQINLLLVEGRWCWQKKRMQ